MTRVVVVGGGISGLATAHALATRSKPGTVEIVLCERARRLGGNIVTEEKDGFVLDGGPDSWVSTKPFATELAKQVGLGDEIVPTNPDTRRVYIAWDDRLHPMPEGLVLGVPTKITPVAKTRLFSVAGKLRMAMEPFVPVKDDPGDESIGAFITRRLGKEASDRLAAPLLGGIFAGDASQLSIRATFPQFLEMEKKHGSLVRAMRAQRRAMAAKNGGGGPAAGSAFLSMKHGLGELVRGIASKLAGVEVRLGAEVKGVAKDPRGAWIVELASGDRVAADHVVFAGPAHAAAAALRATEEPLARALDGFDYASTATAFFGYRAADVKYPLDGTGFVVPRATGRRILAATWVSSKWPGRAPEGHVLVRVFFGGAWGEEHLDEDDDKLVAAGTAELRDLMGLDAAPLFSRVFRFRRASPQPLVGHLDRVARVRALLAERPGLHVLGSGFDGVGIPDCVRQANAVAGAILGA